MLTADRSGYNFDAITLIGGLARVYLAPFPVTCAEKRDGRSLVIPA